MLNILLILYQTKQLQTITALAGMIIEKTSLYMQLMTDVLSE